MSSSPSSASAGAAPAPDLRTPSGKARLGFDGAALLAAFEECARHTGDVPLVALRAGMEQLRRIVLTLGSAFSIASSDITEKLETLAKRIADVEALGACAAPGQGAATPAYSAAAPRVTVQFLVAWEMEKKVTDKVGRAYTSGARSILRLLWFCDFLQVLLGHLTATAEAPSPFKALKDMANDAYEKALAPHHPWVVRKAIGAAMVFCPTEAAFWKRIVVETVPPSDEDAIKHSLRAFLSAMAPVREKLWAFFHEHKLENLP